MEAEDPIDRVMGHDMLVNAMFDDLSDFEGFDVAWIENSANFRPVREPAFRLIPGSQIQHPPEARAIDYFDFFFDDAMWQRMMEESNRYAEQQRAANPPPPSAPRWDPVTVSVLKAFVGLTLSMGALRLPVRHDYWRKIKWLYETRFSQVMSRDRFDSIWRYFHLQDNTVQPAEPDALWKLRWYIDHLVKVFKDVYIPDEHVTIDESMVKFKGRLAFRQYLPSKPTKWGVKVCSLCESSTGYTWNFQVYTGRVAGQQEHGLSYRVVTELTEDLQGSYMMVMMDNFYTGVELLEALRARCLLACGTVRANRREGRPDVFCVDGHKGGADLIELYHYPTARGSVERRNAQGVRAPVVVPKALADYQVHMKGVDLCDQMTGYHLINHRSKKWWSRLYFYLQMIAVHNAYIIAKESNPVEAAAQWPLFQDFVEDLSLELIGNVRSARAAPLVHAPQRATALHEVVPMYERYKTCRECSLRAGPHQRCGVTKYGCRQCQEPVHQTGTCVADHIRRHLQD
ncbi:hypothetical protein LSAT2_031377 [Lamellibrachia satsuma]|nr:hypothetical protein LSAT2_031377 [Lamellibrachia satsuma]